MVLMETPADENSQNLTTAANEAVHEQDNTVPAAINHGGTELEPEAEPEIAEEEVKGILEVIASTGKFWHAWYKLKSMLSFQLKQVLLEYPESKMTSEQQNASLGETYPELVKRLDEALVSFVEGPPFTLQRLCEVVYFIPLVHNPVGSSKCLSKYLKACFSTRKEFIGDNYVDHLYRSVSTSNDAKDR
ncbi:uncharacterized protein LOC121256382 isoform X3 [Juglans microcarpa x Juglans regia]|uniref:uncharacterized protein LOC121256382 isoform X3 n=1 Tax=Juglans microcarpa x Juglans regia TaxID=2249226 RepID=UPI001B7E4DCA|nr:uncharacterized protein LOC121256382 isoform X3 [Juglans microcarpa x Juglans regia]